MDKLKEIFKKKNRFLYMSYMLIVVAILVAFFSLLPLKSGSRSGKSELLIRSRNSGINDMQEESSSAVISVRTFEKNGNPKVSLLVERFYESLMTGDDSKIGKFTDGPGNIDPLKRSINVNYIDSYVSIDCYTMAGMINGTYLVAVEYQVKFRNIDTPVTYIDYLYICTDISGNLYVSTKALSDEVMAYNSLMFESNTIRKLEESIAVRYDAAIQSDPALADFVKGIK